MKTLEALLYEGALTAVRTLTLEELYEQAEYLAEMNLPADLAAFPASVLNFAIREKQIARAMN